MKVQQGEMPTQSVLITEYGATAEEAQRFQLPCGGTLKLLIEPVTGSWVTDLLAQLQQQQLVKRTLSLDDLQVSTSPAHKHDSTLTLTEREFQTVYGPRWRMLIIGATDTAAYLAELARTHDYQVIVCDPREEIRAGWTVSDTDLSSAMPDDAVLAMQPDAHTVIITLTHDPKLDDMALLEALKSPAFYIGALGSRRTNQARRERLMMFDLSESEIARLHGPVGLDIGSRTPPEIAVAIIAELIQLRRGNISVVADDTRLASEPTY
jgi:xanthine dehydrogenase accessory factor